MPKRVLLGALLACGLTASALAQEPRTGGVINAVRSVFGRSRLRKIRHAKPRVAWCPPGLRPHGLGAGARAEDGGRDQRRDPARAARPDACAGPERPDSNGL